jgi:very-short-patch-repair endonuclease
MSAELRLAQLEQIASYHRLQHRWRTDAAWETYLGFPAPVEAIALDNHLTLATWNAAARDALEAMPIPLFSLDDITREKARALKREFEVVSEAAAGAASALEALGTFLPHLATLSNRLSVNEVVSAVGRLVDALSANLNWLRDHAPADAEFPQCLSAIDAGLKRAIIMEELDANREAQAVLGDDFLGVQTNIPAALQAIEFGQYLDRLPLPTALKDQLRRGPLIEAAEEIQALLTALVSGFSKIEALSKALRTYGTFEPDTWIGRSASGGLAAYTDALETRLLKAVDESDGLIPWSLYVVRRKECLELGLVGLVNLLENKRVIPAELADAYAYCAYVTVIRNAFRLIPQLGRFTGLRHDQVREDFRRLDREVIDIRGSAIAAQCTRSSSPPGGRNGTRVDDKTEMALLNHLMPQQRPRVPVRKMVNRAGRAIQSLKPCFMMGPQAVAQYLTPGAVRFDLVIMDEASQLKPEEAIGAIARGAQLVVVGDSKQLPPTSFFSRMSQTADDDDQYSTTDAESILDVCSAHFHPPRPLRWHYRSQHHSLIAFSNHHFYRGGLIVFPSPYGQSGKLGVRATYLADAAYDNQTNLREAERVVSAAVEHILERPEDSLGIVTLNIKQRDLIAELLDGRLRHISGADAYLERWASTGQPLFVKNLENVQGDERDAIVISTTFGKPPGSSVVRQNFGPISRQGGWRRLNVLFTRARKSVAVYTSLRPEDIVDDPATPEGTKALRHYLEYARSGSLVAAVDEGREPDSDFEVAVINVLKARGYEVTPQLGVAGFRIDIAVKHPRAPGTYLAAIECDGATYHSARSVRDRDRIRQEILESLGWRGRIWRIWSTDWFRAPRQEIQKLISFLEDTARTWTPEHAAGQSWVEEGLPSSSFGSNIHTPEAAATVSLGDVLVESGEDLDVRVHDTVRYADVARPDDVLTVQISARGSDLNSGVVGVATPLAQALLGAVAGDEVQLHLPGTAQRTFRVIGITRSSV